MPSTGPELTVTVRLYATLRRFAPEAVDPRSFPVVLPAGATLRTLVERVGLPATQWKKAFRNSAACGETEELHDGDVVAFFPPIAGG